MTKQLVPDMIKSIMQKCTCIPRLQPFSSLNMCCNCRTHSPLRCNPPRNIIVIQAVLCAPPPYPKHPVLNVISPRCRSTALFSPTLDPATVHTQPYTASARHRPKHRPRRGVPGGCSQHRLAGSYRRQGPSPRAGGWAQGCRRRRPQPPQFSLSERRAAAAASPSAHCQTSAQRTAQAWTDSAGKASEAGQEKLLGWQIGGHPLPPPIGQTPHG